MNDRQQVHLLDPVVLGGHLDLDGGQPVGVEVAAMQSVIHSTCCSIDTSMLVSTEGLPGPVTMNRFGKPAVARPR